ncbi:hypothetical protein BIV23_37180 [Streptomyces monashensis]|uniref:Uncharacterized protein n=1 Tax=Streptomyces monashensis TaxID=1678012 RepID=A0A1S2PJ34_9ACTN|nr:hypothetical protein BIV23_37180 [Streptomyces monashensis]
MSFDLWRLQVSSAISWLKSRCLRLVVIARGAGALAVPQEADCELLSLRPPTVLGLRDLLDATSGRRFSPWETVGSGHAGAVSDLGIEARCCGGLNFPRSVLTDLLTGLTSAKVPSTTWLSTAQTHLTLRERAWVTDHVMEWLQ